MKLHNDVKRLLLTNNQIKNGIQKLANKINREYKHKNPILIGVLKGCIPFYNELFLRLTCNPIMDFMIASSYRGTNSTNVKIVTDLRQDISNRHVIIIEDIIDTGKTLKKLGVLLKSRKPKSLKIFCLVDKPACRINKFEPDYSCFKIDPVFAVGFGLDYKEQYRNLPYIAELKEHIYKK